MLKEKFKPLIPWLIGVLSGAIFLGLVVLIEHIEPDLTYKQAIYKGYLSKGSKHTYPIVEIEGEEVRSLESQMVRDISYVGNEVTIAYRGDKIEYFVIQW